MALLYRRETRRAILAAADKARQANKLTADEHRHLRRVMFFRPIQADELCEIVEEDLIATKHLSLTGDMLGIDWGPIIDRIVDQFIEIFKELIKGWLGGLLGGPDD